MRSNTQFCIAASDNVLITISNTKIMARIIYTFSKYQEQQRNNNHNGNILPRKKNDPVETFNIRRKLNMHTGNL